jgi:hypothetical protein
MLKDDKTLSLVSANRPAMELNPVSNGKFTVKYMDGISVEFNESQKDDAVEMLLKTPGGEMKATKKK